MPPADTPQGGGKTLRLVSGLVLTAATGLAAGWGLWLSPQDDPVGVDALFVPNGDPDYARTAKAAALYRQGLAHWMIFSGQGVGGDSATEMARQASRQGVPKTAILIEPQATSTRENASLSAPILRAHGIRSVLIVSSPYHLRRMQLSAKATWSGVTVFTHRDDEPFAPWWWSHAESRRAVAAETWKLLGYASAGWLWPIAFGPE